jgi:uncharacterized protein
MACIEKLIQIKTYVDYFKENVNQPKPLGVLFKTEKKYYFYDTGTSKTMSCEKIECEILQKIISGEFEEIYHLAQISSVNQFIQALENIKQAIDIEDILKAGGDFNFNSPHHSADLHNMIDSGLQQITLELTEGCNLRCGYCIYNDLYKGKRNFGHRNMTQEVAQKAIDYLKYHGDKKEVSVTFYGGEPLVNFDILKKSVKYAQENIKNRKLNFSMTTNLSMMTEEIARYIANIDNFSVLCSLDGPKDIHDSYRKDIDNHGSYVRAIRGLKYLVQAFGDRAKDMISISMVFAPPYYKNKPNEIQRFFENLDWLPKNISKLVTYPNVGSVNGGEDEENTLLKWSNSMYFDSLKNNKEADLFSKGVIEQGFARLHKRPIYKYHNNMYPLNGCCIPANRKIYITVDGSFMLCEKIDGAPKIGNVFDGIDEEKIRTEMVDSYVSNSIKDCKNCWAARLCGICYMYCYSYEKLDLEKKRSYCNSTKSYRLMNMIFYHKCLENNPKYLEYLNKLDDK